ncbi:NAD(P)H-dependent oxidoreductase [Leptospira koniambonensis]|uniref:NAD(P)H-dependent oxidoreductase n=1 Tax=Leptospira koniambonensis TaxID=2484950 RepID=A0A4R9J9N2_9LEPT|nr:NADPH-dependent FMN reductase [Leptospira koniambonensis]TGL34948.1 NAD(P)H-dependent oxidoreductase [Leptospira koniambonensis]
MKVLAVSGSLRKGSSNTALLLAAQRISNDSLQITLADPLDRIPHFNPDLDTDTPPKEITKWRRELKEADAILFSSPEYAFAIPGVLKNALDWIVSSAELYGKPVGLINASPGYGGASKAQEALIQLLNVLTVKINDGCVLSISGVNKKIDSEGYITDAQTEEELRNCLQNIENLIRESG